MTFQDVIIRLSHYWAEQGCLLAQPYDVETGAGTMNPATFLRSLGPEPWRVAYVEPSRRPADGRYGENPNRLYQHWQYQVVLKPAPADVQDIYLGSLEALGLDLQAHDVRFVEDNWEAPTLGAWGLGWEVWLDGMEITQFTYFQQLAGVDAEPVCAELTYGLERLSSYIQEKENVFELTWVPGVTYGEVFKRAEFEHSTYSFETADVDRLIDLFRHYEQEAARTADQGLVLPAMDYVLKCSHTFNLLDARGAISVTQRTGYIGRVRDVACRTAQAYMAQRAESGHPLQEMASWRGAAAVRPQETEAGSRPTNTAADASTAATLALEIGTEELPARDGPRAREQLAENASQALAEARLAHGELRVGATPRRLVLVVEEVAPRQAELEELVRGPAAAVGFDDGGEPTAAARGFARSQDVAVDDLVTRDEDGTPYLYARRVDAGRPAAQVLPQLLQELVAGLDFARTMRWEESGFRFARPIRWLVALYGSSPLALQVAGVSSGTTTRGHRFLAPGPHTVAHAAGLVEVLAANQVMVDPAARRQAIVEQAAAAAARVDGTPVYDDELLDEICYLVEAPQAVLGEFAPAYLELPDEVLLTTMARHQRYMGVRDAGGRLLPYFITISNAAPATAATVQAGNEKVLRARLADARFFYDEDRKQPLDAYLPKLEEIIFAEGLGTVADKSRRMRRLAGWLADQMDLDATERSAVDRAAMLAKADLTTHLVQEFPALQGVMGREYASLSGEDRVVARAIAAHYLPRHSTDALPGFLVGALVSLADRLDTLAGCFSIGLRPSGSQDPYALRRAAIGLLRILAEHELRLPVAELVTQGLAEQPGQPDRDAGRDLLDFLAGRLTRLLRDAGHPVDRVRAVMAAGWDDVPGTYQRAQVLAQLQHETALQDVLHAHTRAAKLAARAETDQVEPKYLQEEAEVALYEEVNARENELRALLAKDAVEGFYRQAASLRAPVDRFMDEVLVMADEPAVRQNRLALLRRVATLLALPADLSQLSM